MGEDVVHSMQLRIQKLEKQIHDLQESISLYKDIVDNLPVGIQVFDHQGFSYSINPKQKELLGLPDLETGIGKFNILTDPFSKTTGANIIFERAYQGESYEHQRKYNFGIEENKWDTRKDIRYFQESIIPIKNHENIVRYVVAILNDVTETKLRERALIESDQKLKSTFDILDAGITITNEEGNIIECNKASENILGITKEEHLRRNYSSEEWNIIRPDGSTMPIEEYPIVRAFKENRTIRNVIMGIVKSENEVTWISVSASPLELKGYGVVVTYFDITDLKTIQEALRISEERLKEAQETAHIGHWELDLKNNSFKWSDEVYRIFSLEPQEVEASIEILLKYIYPEDREYVSELYRSSFNEKTKNEIIHRLLLPDGKIKYVKEKYVIKSDENGKPIYAIGIIADITEHIKQENLIKRQNEDLSRLNATKDKLFSIIAHDLSSPFNGIMGFAELAIEQLEERDYKALEKSLNLVNRNIRQSFELLNNLLHWSRIQAGRIDFHPEYVNFKEIINSATELLMANLYNKEIELSTDVRNNFEIYVDRQMIETVIRNLISNAIKFSYPKGKINLKAEEKENEIIISVKDEGIGINPDDIKKLFNIENNITTKGTNREKGTGLGLILCKDFISYHTGKIWVESSPGKGTTFFFTIPKKLNT